MTMITRRRLMQLGGAAAITWSMTRGARLLRAGGSPARAKRLVVFYFPDGIAGQAQNGDPSLWDLSGSLAPLAAYQSQCVFFKGLSMGPTDSGSHPGGAKKLLT